MSFAFCDGLLARSAGIVTLVISLVVAGDSLAQSPAQEVPNAMQGFAQNRDQPVDIKADAFELRDKKREGTFSGNVRVVQGDTTMRSKTLVVFYEPSSSNQPAARTQSPAGPNRTAKLPPMRAATPGPGGSSSIRRLEARSNVVVTQKGQTVTGNRAVFDTTTNLITMMGDVVLTQCNNVLRGDRLLVDMTTGVSRVEADHEKVSALLDQSAPGCGESGPGIGPQGLRKPMQ